MLDHGVPVFTLSIMAMLETFERFSINLRIIVFYSRQNSRLIKGGWGKNCVLLAPCI